MSPRPQPPDGDDRDLGAALSGLPVPDHGPTFWADLAGRLAGDAVEVEGPPARPLPVPTPVRGETTVPRATESVTAAGPDPETAA
ncbi:MAG TPA: hypothetical protein VHL53_21670, partial [Acidimicrobiia bacterium]|nr:hypothetical protein [Acidimicrobiia bacterium]